MKHSSSIMDQFSKVLTPIGHLDPRRLENRAQDKKKKIILELKGLKGSKREHAELDCDADATRGLQ